MRGRCRDLKAVLRRRGLSYNALNSLPTGQNGNDKRHNTGNEPLTVTQTRVLVQLEWGASP